MSMIPVVVFFVISPSFVLTDASRIDKIIFVVTVDVAQAWTVIFITNVIVNVFAMVCLS